MRVILFLACFSLVSFQLNANSHNSGNSNSNVHLADATLPVSCPAGTPAGKDPCTCGTYVEGTACQLGNSVGACEVQNDGTFGCVVSSAVIATQNTANCNNLGHSTSNWLILASILIGLFGLSKMLKRVE